MALTAQVLFWVCTLQAFSALDNRCAEHSEASTNGCTNGCEDCLDALPTQNKWQTASFTAGFQPFTDVGAQLLRATANPRCCRSEALSTQHKRQTACLTASFQAFTNVSAQLGGASGAASAKGIETGQARSTAGYEATLDAISTGRETCDAGRATRIGAVFTARLAV